MEKLDMACPVCNKTDWKDISPTHSNEVFGPGYSSVKTIELWKCKNCKVVISPDPEDIKKD